MATVRSSTNRKQVRNQATSKTKSRPLATVNKRTPRSRPVVEAAQALREHDQTATAVENLGALTRPVAARYIGVCVRTLDRLGNEGRIRKCKIGTKTVYKRADLDYFLSNL
ncbi:MAG: helix-turn-helix domain-containing protein [Pirellulaceae bacterium]|nr:helix-turn-helix domain-containing protein [Pirellulaceae bacterium]